MAAIFPGATVGYGLNEFHNTNELGNSSLSMALSGSPATFSVDNAANVTTWPSASFTVRIDNELIFCTSRSGLSITIGTRGAFGTAQANHDSASIVRVVHTSAMIQQMAAEIQAMQGWAGVGGTLVHASVTTTPYTATSADFLIPVNATAASATINLPTAVGIKGRAYSIVKTDATANTVTVDASGTETVGGALTQVLRSQNDSILIHSDGANWQIAASTINSTSGLYATAASQSVSSWVSEGWDTVSTVGASGSTASNAGVCLQLPFSTSAAVGAIGTLGFIAESLAGTLDFSAGDVLKYVAKMNFGSWSGLNANQLVGFTMSQAYATADCVKTNVRERITVGVDSTGTVFLVTNDDAAGVTSTSTSQTVSAGVSRKFEVVFTKGTSVTLAIDGTVYATNTTNLPNAVSVVNYGCGTSTTTPPTPVRVFRPAYKITSTGN